jgi:hypothetical protein
VTRYRQILQKTLETSPFRNQSQSKSTHVITRRLSEKNA